MLAIAKLLGSKSIKPILKTNVISNLQDNLKRSNDQHKFHRCQFPVNHRGNRMKDKSRRQNLVDVCLSNNCDTFLFNFEVNKYRSKEKQTLYTETSIIEMIHPLDARMPTVLPKAALTLVCAIYLRHLS